jgi:sialidase-1
MFDYRFFPVLIIVAVMISMPFAGADRAKGVTQTLELAPGPDNPRNSEGDFIALRDGRILFVYTHFTGGGGDHDSAFLAGRYSEDGGRTWTEKDTVVLPNEGGMNIMSVSLLRLQDGRIGLLYLRKNATDDCRPLLRFSEDEGASWSDPVCCIEEPIGYYVVNNDRLVQLTSGELVIPAARHALKGEKFSGRGKALCALSNDGGRTWRLSKSLLEAPADIRTGLQEPGVIELKDGRLMMLSRTSGGCQYRSWSEDKGETWSKPEATEILSPVSPASFERIPSTGDILLVWNDHSAIDPALKGKRTPFNTAISKDEGKTWEHTRTLEDNPDGWYCYTAIHFTDDAVLLGHCAGDRTENNGLALTQVLRFSRAWPYAE